MNMTSNLPPDILERQAVQQRDRIADSVTELKESLRETVRERLDVNRYARQHLGKLAGLASVFAFAVGYAITGMFTRH
jgi:hypothetical protein